jgi:nucleoid DNA-binding protein
MKNTIEHYISQLLYTNDCVILIGFGGFVCSNTTSKLNRQTGLLSPPNRSILFNNQLIDNDGLLINQIAKTEEISQEKAKDLVLKFVEKNTTNLKKYRSLRFKKIGLFTLKNDNTIAFTQDLATNYNLDSFGMQSAVFTSVKRDNSETIEGQLKIIKQKNNFSSKRLLKVAAILIPLIGISLVSLTQQKNINSIYTQMADLNPFNTEVEEKTIIAIAEINKKVNIPILNIEIDNTDKKPILVEQKYYIIAGAFSVEKNATKMMNKLNRWNYNSTIINNKSIMRVSYDSFTTKNQAINALVSIRKENPDAWILSI